MLEDRDQRPVGGSDGQQVQDDRLDRHHDRPERDQEEQERQGQDESEHQRCAAATDVESFAEAIRRVAGDGSALDPEVVSALLGRRRRDDPLAVLTPREREVLGLMAEGRSNIGIAGALVVTERAVEKHVTSIFAKLGLPAASADHRRVLAVLTFLGG